MTLTPHMPTLGRKGTGWLPPRPDLRDYTPARVTAIAGTTVPATPPSTVDLRSLFGPVYDQGQLGSCTANAAVGILEYLETRAYGVTGQTPSRLFVYKASRNLLGLVGDTGAYLRTAMGALALLGAPPEKYWPYTDGPTFDHEPPSFVYGIADDYEGLTYFCHDPIGSNTPPATVLTSIKTWVAGGWPTMFGFYGFDSFQDTDTPGAFPFPGPNEEAAWGHAVVVVGYDDSKVITNTRYNVTTTGAALIRNSWGAAWGEAGYGWMPYEYWLSGLASDCWSLTSAGHVASGQFGLT